MKFRCGQLVRFIWPGSHLSGRLAHVEDYWWTDAPPVVGICFVPLEGERARSLLCVEADLDAVEISREEPTP